MKTFKSKSLVAAALFAAFAEGYEIPFEGDFSEIRQDGFPAEWVWYDEGGSDPELIRSKSWSHAEAKVERADGGNELHVFGTKAGKGTLLRSRGRIPGRAGDIVTVTLEARGSGKAGFSVFGWNEKGGLARGLPTHFVDLTSEWKKVSHTFTVSDHITKAVSFEVVLELRPSADVRFRNVKVTRNLETARMLAMDDYESDSIRSGNPEIVNGDIAPGLLMSTRKGVYRTSGRVDVVPAARLEMPPSGEFLTSAVRVYGFGSGGAGKIETSFRDGGKEFLLTIAPKAGDVACSFTGGGNFAVPESFLPADFVFSASRDGACELVVTSLSNSQTKRFDGSFEFFRNVSGGVTRAVSLVSADGKAAEVTVDNMSLAVSRPERLAEIAYPYLAKPLPEFDPVKAGWPLVFSDEFNGSEIDYAKWVMDEGKGKAYARVEDGKLKILAGYAPGSTNKLETTGLRSVPSFLYGYFEARVKFTTYNGWWAAFWLYSRSFGNPFLDGMEIDIFEDYYMRNPERKTLDHNLHIPCGVLKSWNYNSTIPGTYRDWYTIGCKWTPFEITYYLDGKAIPSKAAGSPYNTVTFDAFRHGTTIKPLHAIVSGQIMKTAYGKHDPDPSEVYPEAYEVDHVRVYGYPGATPGATPEVALESSIGGGTCVVKAGTPLMFKVSAKSGAKSGAKIKAVHLFDGGHYIATKTVPPYDFTFPFTEAYFSRTQWSMPGRSGVRPGFKGAMHVFCAFAEDENGEVGHSQTIPVLVASDVKSSPFRGKAAVVPGVIKAGHYDEGGQGVAYYDSTKGHFGDNKWRPDECVDGGESTIGNIGTGEWIKYTIDIQKAGRYRVKFHYGTPRDFGHRVDLLLDDKQIGTIGPLKQHKASHWGVDTVSETEVVLPAGRHVLRILFVGSFNAGAIEFVEI